jgi:hypothetical protein
MYLYGSTEHLEHLESLSMDGDYLLAEAYKEQRAGAGVLDDDDNSLWGCLEVIQASLAFTMAAARGKHLPMRLSERFYVDAPAGTGQGFREVYAVEVN